MLRRTCRGFCASNILLKEIEHTVANINEHTLRPLDVCGHFVSKARYSTPMAILLGNHSAGKSTLINKLLGGPVQNTGVAPTDDGFTVIQRGDVNVDEDGPSAVSNPDLGFAELKPFGPSFVNHFKIKTRVLNSSKLPKGMMIIDTPGMIDTPAPSTSSSRTSLEGQGRGYDFIGVTKWFAQRSDVILLLFDPHNPGTTGETLDVLTNALRGHEHKFLILLNKVDTFDQVVDFARTYGTLTWNLSKVIDRKDIPRIYTTFTEVGVDTGVVGTQHARTKTAVPIAELQRSVNDVIEEVMKAPISRIGHLITESQESAERVAMSLRVQNSILSQHNYNKFVAYGIVGLAAVGTPVALVTVLVPLEAVSIAMTGAVILAGAAFGLSSFTRRQETQARKLIDDIDHIFDECYAPTDQTEDIKHRWKNYVRQPIVDVLKTKGPEGLRGATSRELRKLDALINSDFPALRTKASECRSLLMRGEAAKEAH